MKKLGILFIFNLLITYAALASSIEPEQEIFSELSNHFKSGNVKEIAKYFANSVDITLPSSEDQYSKSQAEIVLKNFFNSHTPTGFTIEHQGASNNGKYMVGSLSTNKGVYKVYVFVKDNGGQKNISELKIETP